MSGQEPDADEVAAAPPFGDSAIKRAAVANPEFVDLSFAAKAATDNERSMTLLQGIKLYPKAVGWSMLLSTCIVMEGYDLVLLGRYVLGHTLPHLAHYLSCRPYTLLCQKQKTDFLAASTPSPSSRPSTVSYSQTAPR